MLKNFFRSIMERVVTVLVGIALAESFAYRNWFVALGESVKDICRFACWLARILCNSIYYSEGLDIFLRLAGKMYGALSSNFVAGMFIAALLMTAVRFLGRPVSKAKVLKTKKITLLTPSTTQTPVLKQLHAPTGLKTN